MPVRKESTEFTAFGIDTRAVYQALHRDNTANIMAVDQKARAEDAAFYQGIPTPKADTDPSNLSAQQARNAELLNILKARGETLQATPTPLSANNNATATSATATTTTPLQDVPPPASNPVKSKNQSKNQSKNRALQIFLDYPLDCPRHVFAIFNDLYNWDALPGSPTFKLKTVFYKQARFEYFMSVMLLVVLVAVLVHYS